MSYWERVPETYKRDIIPFTRGSKELGRLTVKIKPRFVKTIHKKPLKLYFSAVVLSNLDL